MPTASSPIRLRPFQHTVVRALASGRRGFMSIASIATGGGKTPIAAGLAEAWLAIDPTYTVLYLTPRTELVQQARKTFARFPGLAANPRGQRGSAEASAAGESGARVVFMTTQTWLRGREAGRLPASLTSCAGLLVIVDECHWAIRARTGQTILDCYLPDSHVVGLTATPVDEPSGRTVIVYEKGFAELVNAGLLARPRIVDIQTGHTWDPVVRLDRFSPESLRQLGTEPVRNEVIVNVLLRGRGAGVYRRVLIFACDVSHALELKRALDQRGIAVRVAYGTQRPKERASAIRDFAMGRASVLVNVELLTHGVDIPEIDAVFLARPTRSRVLYAQMVGRGARLAEGKSSFDVVVFNDTIRQLGREVFHPRGLLSGQRNRRRARPAGVAVRHSESTGEPAFELLGDMGDLTGIPLARHQTFGVEIEISCRGAVPSRSERAWLEPAHHLLEAVTRAATAPVHRIPLRYHGGQDLDSWHLEHDASAGWEVISPILFNAEGFAELNRVLLAVQDVVAERPQLHMNHRAGLHVTFGTEFRTESQLAGLVRRVQRLEPGLFTIVAPSRLYQFTPGADYDLTRRNSYCAPVRGLAGLPDDQLINKLLTDRYRTLNLCRAGTDACLLEVRMHQGTTDPLKVIPWIALWMAIFNRALHENRGLPSMVGPVFPGGNQVIGPAAANYEDLFRLLDLEAITLAPVLRAFLADRRRELRTAWQRAIPKRVSSWQGAGWYLPRVATDPSRGPTTQPPTWATSRNLGFPRSHEETDTHLAPVGL